MAKKKELYYDQDGYVVGLDFPFPHSVYDFEKFEDFQRALIEAEYQHNEAQRAEQRTVEMVSQGVVNALAQHFPRQRPPVDRDFLASLSDNKEDARRGKDRINARTVVSDLRQKADRLERTNPKRAQELREMADFQDIGSREKGSYTWERETQSKMENDAFKTFEALKDQPGHKDLEAHYDQISKMAKAYNADLLSQKNPKGELMAVARDWKGRAVATWANVGDLRQHGNYDGQIKAEISSKYPPVNPPKGSVVGGSELGGVFHHFDEEEETPPPAKPEVSREEWLASLTPVK